LHPELKIYFTKDDTDFIKMTWGPYQGQSIGTGFRHDENLKDKRWEIFCEIYNEETNAFGKFYCIVLFHSASNFEIEYLRVDLFTPFNKKYTIIDGRREAKDWVEELDDKKVDKRNYPYYREEEKIKY
jgi:hypothetical protein